jgi:Holliday junction DNA helicase RuvA
MISFLKGQIAFKGINKVEIEVGQIGYEVFVSGRDLSKLSLKEQTEIFVYHYLAEDKNEFYGFLERRDKQVFEMLLSVSGIGPKTALAVFTAGDGPTILKAVSGADVNFFKQVKGLGGKGAQRIIVDLKSKAGSVVDLDFGLIAVDESVYEALIGLGFSPKEARSVLVKLPLELKTENEKIKYALRELGKK